MSERAGSVGDNPLFIRYGNMVDQCFQPDLAADAQIAIFPLVVKGVRSGRVTFGDDEKPIDTYADPAQLASARKRVTQLRETLNKEASDGAPGPTARKLQEFRNGLQRGSERMLEENPFYELTILFYRINLTAMQRAFAALDSEAMQNPPRSIKVSRSLRHIWGRQSMTTFGQRLAETLGKLFSVGKIGFGMLLFAGSTMTTAKGVTDLVQLQGFIDLFGDGLAGSEGENARFALSIFIGLALSSVILDFKSRLFQGIAETGKVFKGLWTAAGYYPRWVFLSCFLTMISIWTNYDGIVLMMSKTQDLSYQWEKIQEQVDSALGDPNELDPDHPDSLLDLQAAMRKKSAAAIEKFKKVPDDEMSGAASSGVARKGPRYYAKYFIVYGGYAPHRNDVGTTYRKTGFVDRVDALLRGSGIDLTLPLEEKINRILNGYDAHIDETRRAVDAGMAGLADTMTLKSYSLDELNALFKLEAYHVNESVQKVVGHLAKNKEAFAEAAGAINRLAEEYIALLQKVDKLGTPANNDYTIDVRFDIPPVEAIDRLAKGKIPMAERRTLAELKNILMERHGAVIGGSVLSLILFIAVFMDMSDPILYGAMVARWGRRDRQFLDENVKHFLVWEEQFVRELKAFFLRPDIRPVLPHLDCPRNRVFRNVYNLFLEEMEPTAKDPTTQGLFERLRFWFLGLFLDSRISHVDGYNARQTVIQRYIRERETYAPRLINRVFPGIMDEFKVGRDHLVSLHRRVARELTAGTERFSAQLADLSPNGAVRSGTTGVLTRSLGPVFDILFFRPLIPHPEPCPLTRISWIRRIALSQVHSRDQINALTGFIPGLVRLLKSTLPQVEKNTLGPLLETLKQIPNWQSIERAFEVNTLRDRFNELERGLLVILGLSQFQGFRVREEMVRTIIEQLGVEEIANVYLHRTGDESAIEKRIVQLEARLVRAHNLVRNLVENQNSLIFTLTKIRRDHLTPINATLSKLQARDRIEAFLGLATMKEELEVIEQCLLELWDTSAAGQPDDAGQAERVQRGRFDLDVVISRVTGNRPDAVFDLIDHVQRLERRIAEARKKLDGAIYHLTMIDRISANILGILEQSLEYVRAILVKDAELLDLRVDGAALDQKKINFLHDNRFYFKSIPLQVESVRTRVDSLINDDNLAAAHNLELARELERQTIKLRYFLRNALDYLEGRRDGIGLSASLADLSSGKLQPPPDGTHSLKPLERIFEEEEPPPELPLERQTANQLVSGTRHAYEDAKKQLLDIGLAEWDLLKQPIPPKALLAEVQNSRDKVARAWEEVEGIRHRLDVAVADGGPTRADPKALLKLRQEIDRVLDQLRAVHGEISKPSIIDRRLEHAREAGDAGTRGPEKAVAGERKPSRRVSERVVLKSEVELELPNGATFRCQSRDVSTRGLLLEAGKPVNGIDAGMRLVFRMLSDAEKATFPASVVRVSGPLIILTLQPGHEAAFVNLVRSEVFQGKGGSPALLDLKVPTVPRFEGGEAAS